MPGTLCRWLLKRISHWVISGELQWNETSWLLISCFFTEKQFSFRLVGLHSGGPHSPSSEHAGSVSQETPWRRQHEAEDPSCSSWSRAEQREGQGEFTTSRGRLIRKNCQAISICIFARVRLGKGRWFWMSTAPSFSPETCSNLSPCSQKLLPCIIQGAR